MITATIYACRNPQTGPHNRCAHPTALPPGYRRCAGDYACPVLLSREDPSPLCPGCEAEAVIRQSPGFGFYAELMKTRR